MKYIALITAASALGFSSCKNPADSKNDAQVSDAQEVATSENGTTYTFTEDSTIKFIGSKVTGSQEGSFKTFTGQFVLEEGEPTSGSASIDMHSTHTEKEKLTAHLKNADFFDVEKFPTTTFSVTQFKKNSDTSYDLSMNVELHGVTKNITFPTTVEKSEDSIHIKAEFNINRQDFGISYAGKKDDLIRDEVVIKLDIKAKPQAE